MKIVVTAEGPDLDARLGTNFARSGYYLVVDVDTMGCEARANQWLTAGGGVGVKVAQMIVPLEPEAVVTGTIGPNAFAVLEGAGIPVFAAPPGTVRSAIQAYRSAHLLPLVKPNAVPHAPFQRLVLPHLDTSRRRPAALRKGKRARDQWPGDRDELAEATARARALQEELEAVQARLRELEGRAQERPE